MISRRTLRKNAIAVIYNHLMTGKTIDEILEDNNFSVTISDFIEPFDLDDELLDACYRVEDRLDIYVPVINSQLKGNWRFDRLGVMEQAILAFALAELEQSIQDKTIIVNEAIELAKIYCDKDAYKLINGVLDSL